MDLFLSDDCPNCAALKARVDLEAVEGLSLHVVPRSGVPDSEAEADSLALADLYGVRSTPVLVGGAGTQKVVDVFEILEVLKALEKPAQ